MKQRGRHSSAIEVSRVDGKRRLRLGFAPGAPSALQRAAMRYFDDDFMAVRGMVVELPAFIEHARRLDPAFYCSQEALDIILEERDRRRRADLAGQLSDTDISSVVNARLYPYQLEAVRFIFREGRALLADEPGLGKLTEAIAATELFKARKMAANALIVCPTSLKYQWAAEIERLTGQQPTIIEGPHDSRRALYASASPYRIVSYHTLANDIKALGILRSDIVVLDQLQRLHLWNPHIANAVRQIDADFAIGLAPIPLEAIETSGICTFIDPDCDSTTLKYRVLRRTYTDVQEQLPATIRKTVFVPMTKEQRSTHDKCRADVARITDKWLKLRFLSEKERERLLKLMTDMRKSCASTALLDNAARSDTKIAEAVQYISDMAANASAAIVVFTSWEAMAKMLSTALEREGLHSKATIIADSGLPGHDIIPCDLALHLDIPWDCNVFKRRMSRTEPEAGCRIVSFISADSIEESINRLPADESLYGGISLESMLNGVTLTDTQLDVISEILVQLLPHGNSSPTGAMIAGTEQESLADDSTQQAPDTEELIANGTNFLEGLARTLQSSEATERLLDAITTQSPDGQTYLHIPLSRRTVATLLTALSKVK